MSGRNMTSVMSALAVAVPLSASSVASAQEAIVLETIGAVRIAQPDEVRRMAAEHEKARVPQSQQRREEKEASAR